MSKTRLTYLIGVLLISVAVAHGYSAKQPPIMVSKETTFITGPLREDGSLDCVAAINDLASQGITLENNAAVLIWRALGPKHIPSEKRDSYFKLLGVPTLPEKGEYFQLINDYSRKLDEPEQRLMDQMQGQLEQALKRPWSKEEFPELAELLQKNEAPLKLITEASRKLRFYMPFVSPKNDILKIETFMIGDLRDVAQQLSARAMLKLMDGQQDAAWEDLMACIRIGRLYSQGVLLVDLFVGVAIGSCAGQGMVAITRHGDIKKDDLQKYLADLQNLPESTRIDKIYGLGERIFFVGTICDIANNHDSLKGMMHLMKDSTKNALTQLASDPTMDWNEVLRIGQDDFDSYQKALALPTYPLANRELSKIRAAEKKKDIEFLEPETLEKSISDQATPREKAECFLRLLSNHEVMGDYSILIPSTRREAVLRMTRLVLALSAYHGEKHAYPSTLADLTPGYLPQIPKDPFSEKDIFFKSKPDRFVLYSVGENEKDDDGRNFLQEHDTDLLEAMKTAGEEEQKSDDIVIRVP